MSLQATILANNPIAYWRMGANGNDLGSGNTPFTTYTAAGANKTALLADVQPSFLAVASTNVYNTGPVAAGPGLTGDITFLATVRINTASGGAFGDIINNATTGSFRFGVIQTTNAIAFRRLKAAVQVINITSTTGFTAGGVHMVGFTQTGTTGQFFLDGQPLGAAQSGLTAGPYDDIVLANGYGSGNSPTSAATGTNMQEITIFGSALSSTTMANIFQVAIAGGQGSGTLYMSWMRN